MPSLKHRKVPCLLLDSHGHLPTLIVTFTMESIIFLGIGPWRFSREKLLGKENFPNE